MAETNHPDLSFLGEEGAAPAALRAAEAALRRYLSPTLGVTPAGPAAGPAHSPTEAHAAVDAVELDAPLGSLEDAIVELGPLWLEDAVRYDSPSYLAHLNCPVAAESLAAAALSAAMNTALETWDQARGAAAIEDRLVRWAAGLAGMDPQEASGVFTSGGSQSNLQALYTARERHAARGAAPCEVAVVASVDAHFSVARGARILGLEFRPVATGVGGGIDVAALEEELEELSGRGRCACVVLTAGTTDLGAIDDLRAAGQAARRHGAYLHVDCAYGGALLLSPTRRDSLAGLELADSFSIDFHKGFFQPVACAALIYRDAGDIAHVTRHADYLNRPGDAYPNLADRSLQTTRRFDALKLWLTLRVSGAAAIGEAIDRCCAIACDTYRLIAGDPDFEAAGEPTLSTVLFRYRPGWLSAKDADWLNSRIRIDLFEANDLVLAETRLAGATFLKFTILNPRLEIADIRRDIDLVRRAGKKIAPMCAKEKAQ